jgi:hypothetical protein
VLIINRGNSQVKRSEVARETCTGPHVWIVALVPVHAGGNQPLQVFFFLVRMNGNLQGLSPGNPGQSGPGTPQDNIMLTVKEVRFCSLPY